MTFQDQTRRDSDSLGLNIPNGLRVDARTATDQISKVLNERGKRYGDFSHHAAVCQAIKGVMLDNPNSKYKHLSADKKQALDVIADKIARILTGDPEYDDNWIDIQGYAKLAQERLRKPQENPLTTSSGWGPMNSMFYGTTPADFPKI